MAKPSDTTVPAAFAPHLHAGEELRHYAYGVKQPHMVAIILLVTLGGVLPGIIAVALFTRHYFIGMTDRRLVVLRIKSMGNHQVKEVVEYDLGGLDAGAVRTAAGPIFTHIRIQDPAKRFAAKFHRRAMKTNREHSRAIANALAGGELAVAA